MSGRVVILNGAPRSGKSSIARAMQQTLGGVWINLGVDSAMAAMPPHLKPGLGLRPGGERPDLEPLLQQQFAAMFGSIAAHAEAGLDVVSDLGIHDFYSKPLGILDGAVRRLGGLRVLFVGVHCPIDVIMARRNADPQGGYYETGATPPDTVMRWEAVHQPGIYDLELDSSKQSPSESAAAIGTMLQSPPSPTAFERLARG
ncbi:MAG: chloramphenicol phosphotransferase [Devosia sp.]